MVESIYRTDYISQVSYKSSVAIISTKNANLFYKNNQEYQSIICDLLSRAYFFIAVLKIVRLSISREKFDELELFYNFNVDNIQKPVDLIKFQNITLLLSGYKQDLQENMWIIRGNDFEIELYFSITSSQLGSLLNNYIVKIVTKSANEIICSVVASILVTFLFNNGIEVDFSIKFPNKVSPTYICTLDANITENRSDLISEAARLLSSNFDPKSEAGIFVNKARQLCLKAAGFDPGTIDGVRGQKTIEAEINYSNYFGGIQINWYSPAFTRHVVNHASMRNENRQ